MRRGAALGGEKAGFTSRGDAARKLEERTAGPVEVPGEEAPVELDAAEPVRVELPGDAKEGVFKGVR